MNRLSGLLVVSGFAVIFSISSASAGTYEQNFDTPPWGNLGSTAYYINADGWSTSNATVQAFFFGLYQPDTEPYAAWLTSPISAATPNKPYIASPLLDRGCGRVQWACKSEAAGWNIYTIESSLDGSSWDIEATFTNASTTWATNYYDVNIYSGAYVRIRKQEDSGSGVQLAIDSISITLPPFDALVGGGRIQDFDDPWGNLGSPAYYMNADGWATSNTTVQAEFFGLLKPASPPNAAWMNTPITNGAPNKPWISSSLLSNGCSTLEWACKNQSAGTNVYEIQWSLDRNSWITARTYTNTSSTWTTNSLELNTYSNVYLRIYKTLDIGSEMMLAIDNIVARAPQADVVITNLFISPGYPGTANVVTVSCDLYSASSLFEAFDLDPKLVYRASSGSWVTNPLNFSAGNTWTSTIPPLPPDTVEYFIRCDFSGSYFSNNLLTSQRSPSFLPEAPATNDAPGEFFSYIPRRFMSSYDVIAISTNSAVKPESMLLIGDNNWQGFLGAPSSTQILVRFMASGYFNGSGIDPGTNAWGDSDQVFYSPPISGFATDGGSDIVININTGSMSQIIFFFNSDTGYYEVRRGAFQDFNEWIDTHPTKFDHSISGSDMSIISNNFNSWPLDSNYVTPFEDGQANFEDPLWVQTTGYYETVRGPGSWGGSGVNDGYWVDDFRIVPENDGGHACEFIPTPNNGATWQDEYILTDGLEKLDWRARCYFPEHYHTWYTNGLGWSNYYVKADLIATDEGTAYPTLSLLAYYQNSSNYYECFFKQADMNTTSSKPRGQFGMRSVINGVVSTSYSPETRDNWLISAGATITFSVSKEANDRVSLRAHISQQNRTREYVHVATNLIGGGSIGLRTFDTAIDADNIEVGERIVRHFNFGNQSWMTSRTDDLGWQYNNCRQYSSSIYLTNSTAASVITAKLATSPTKIELWLNSNTASSNTLMYLDGFNGSTWVNGIDSYTFDGGWDYRSTTGGIGGYEQFRLRNGNSKAILRIDKMVITGSPYYQENFDDGLAQNWEAPDGYWNVAAGKYKRQAYCGPTIRYELWANPNTNVIDYPGPGDPNWFKVNTYTMSNHHYEAKSEELHYWNKHFTKIKHTTGAGSMRVDDITMTSWRAKDFETNGWRTTEGWTAQQAPGNHEIELWRSRADPTNAQSIRTPLMTNGVGSISFDYDFQQLGGSTGLITAQYAYITNGSWTTWNTWPATNEGPNQGYFSFKTNANWYVRLRHTTPTNSAILTIDNIKVTDYATRDSETWEAYNVLITDNSTHENREFEPFISDGVRTAYINNRSNIGTVDVYTNSLAFIQSARIDEGIGRVSFWYRAWGDASPPGRLLLYKSPTEAAAWTNWTLLDEVIITADKEYYQFYQKDFYEKDDLYVRLVATNGLFDGRVCVDNMLVTQPLAADFEFQEIAITPTIPLFTNQVKIAAEIGRFVMNPENIQAKAYYNFGTNDWGNTNNTWPASNFLDLDVIAWSNSTGIRFESTDSIPAQPIDTVVQYYIECTFTGTFSNITSPKKGRIFTNPSWYEPIDLNAAHAVSTPYYFVFSCLPGTVWINEVNYQRRTDENTNEYVELCGPAGTVVSNWQIELVDTVTQIYDTAIMNNIYSLPNDYNGFGFYVLGDPEVGTADLNFDTPTDNNLQLSGGVRLTRSMGAWEQKICYGPSGLAMTNAGFEYIGQKSSGFRHSPLYLTGTGEAYDAFTWTYASDSSYYYTPGLPNDAQTLEWAVPPPPTYTIMISNFWSTSSNTWIVTVSTHTNRIEVNPWYCTNLINTNWVAVTNSRIVSETFTPSSGTYTQWFDNVTNPAPVYFRVTSTNEP